MCFTALFLTCVVDMFVTDWSLTGVVDVFVTDWSLTGVVDVFVSPAGSGSALRDHRGALGPRGRGSAVGRLRGGTRDADAAAGERHRS